VRRIGILTGGGDAPGLNSVIRAVVLTASNELDLEVVGIRDGFGGFFEVDGVMPLDRAAVRGLLWRGGSILGCNNRFRGDPKRFVERVRELGLDGVIVAGGDGSLRIAQQMQEAGAKMVGVPKTIDNDVPGTDQTFGFDTAVNLVAEACSRLIDTAESHHRIMIVEVMGRNAGHIALHGALSGSADIALIPEIPYSLQSIKKHIDERLVEGRTYTLMVVAEGATEQGGQVVLDQRRTQLAGRSVLGGIGEHLAERLRAVMPHEVRALALSHLQRGGRPTAFDRVLGTRMGVAAARALGAGRSGVFTAFRNGKVLLAPLEESTAGIRTVNADGRLISSARAVGLAFGDE